MSILTENLPTTRLNVDGLTVNKQKKLDILREWFKTGAFSRMDASKKLGISPVKAYTDYMKILLDEGSIKKIENTQKYTGTETKITKELLRQELVTKSEIMQTALMQNWMKNNKSKGNHIDLVRFARICIGKVNPKFKIHPDSITKDNWETVVSNMVDAILDTYDKPQKEPHYSDRQTIRHAIMYGLDVVISEEKGKRLRISGDKGTPKVADLRISKEQTQNCKLILRKDPEPTWFVKFGFKCWTFVRPSTIYIVQTKDLEFYDRTVEYVEIDGTKNFKKDVIDFMKKLLVVFPQISEKVKIDSYTHRACRLQVFEHKTQSDFQKYIWDEEFVVALEKYVAQRKFQKKKYLFWNDNATEFVFETYDNVVKYQVVKDNDYYKKTLSDVGFEREDFGEYFRANYGFRHFGLQMWLEATDFDYDFVGSMSHEDTTTLKKWYGKISAQHHEKKASEAHF